jgi:hypothetical protein
MEIPSNEFLVLIFEINAYIKAQSKIKNVSSKTICFLS